jgi:hypothetical protein
MRYVVKVIEQNWSQDLEDLLACRGVLPFSNNKSIKIPASGYSGTILGGSDGRETESVTGES